MTIVLFIIAWLILGIIAIRIVARVAKKSIEQVENVVECTDTDLVTVMTNEAETESKEGNNFLTNMLNHPILTIIIAIIFWPLIMPLSLYGWNHLEYL